MRLAAGSETWTISAASLSVSSLEASLEVVQELDLGQRQLERADGLEQVRVAVLVEVDDERVEVRREVAARGCPARFGSGRSSALSSYLHACKYCTLGRVAPRGCFFKRLESLGLEELV